MKDDWTHLFGDEDAAKLTRKTLKDLSGFYPNDQQHCIAFARRLGILPKGIESIEDLVPKTEENCFTLADDPEVEIGDETNPDYDYLEAIKEAKIAQQWDDAKMTNGVREILGTSANDHIRRAQIYLKWSQLTQCLVSPSFLSKNISVYRNLNLILCHVRIPIES